MSLVLQATSGVWIISYGSDVTPGWSLSIFDMAALEMRRAVALDLRRPDEARAFVVRVAARPGHLVRLRRFAGERLPVTTGTCEKAAVMEELARLFAAGHLHASVLRTELPVLRERDVVEEVAPAPQVPVPEKVEAPPKVDICWPCLLAALASARTQPVARSLPASLDLSMMQMAAAASARTLREAARQGVPFISDG